MADFLAVEPFPFPLVESGHQRQDVLGMHHVDESVANIAFVFEVNWQIEKVVLAAELLVDSLQQHLLCVLVWNVFDHEGGPCVLPCTHNHRITRLMLLTCRCRHNSKP